MKTSISSKSPHSPLSTISAPITIEASATSLSSVVSSLPALVATASSSVSKITHVSVKCGISCGRNTSPCNVESIRSQSLDDNTHKMLIKQNARGGCKIINIPTMSATNHERDSSIASLSNSIRQNSAKINNCSINHAESSTNNGGSAKTASSTSESSANVNEEGKKTLTKEDDREKSNSSTSSTASISSSNSNTTFTTSLSTISNNLSATKLGVHKNMTGVEEDKDVTIKEEHIISPNISPLGFSPLGQGPNTNSAIPETCVSKAKLNEGISTKKCNVLSNKVHFLPNIVCNGNEESNNKNQTSVILSQSSGYTYSSNTNSNGMPHISGNSTVAGGSCLDYMQHQNHIFVFSTQLANKSADAVLNGQFPTIIAYHCSQPATKSFLEDFFLKNSMKMTKLQRQSTLNMCNISIGNSGEVLGTQSWLNTIGKMPQKTSDNKNGEDNDIHAWDQTHSDIEASSAGRNSRKSTDNVVSRNNSNNTKPLGVTELDANIPSLQGVKVPDENLTPQQRQHREEQLAKLKKIDQILFPENDSTEFRGEISSNQVRKITVDGIVTTLPSNLMHNISSNANSSSCIKNSIQNISNNLMKAEGMPATTDNASTSTNSNDLSILSGYNSNKVSNIRLNNSIMDSLANSLTSSVSNILPNISGSASINNSPVNPMNNMVNNPITKNTLENLNNSAMLPTTGSSNVLNDENSGSNSLNSNAISEFVQNFPTISSDRDNSSVLDGNQKHIVVSNSGHPNIAGSSEGVGGSLAQMEWSTLQQQFYGERFKINVTDTGCIITPSSRPSSIITNGNTHSNTMSSESSVASSHRSVQGPPPPYHQSTGTQRPASVPISTQSSNPASPNNPTSNLSLPSPRTSSIMGMTNNSPNIDTASLSVVSSSISTPASVAISVVSAGGGVSSNCINNLTKISFSQEELPSSKQPLIAGGRNVVLCNRNNTSVLSSYPATSLSDISSKEMDTSILVNSPSDTSKMESRFSSAGLMCSRGAGSNTSGTNNGFKNQSSLERQNTPQMSSQFNRRSDNIPLNPNSNRTLQNKMINAFDPISSLAQMSQQLTGCVGLGNHSSNMSILGSTGGATVGEVSSGLSIDNVIGPLETSLEHCSTSANISIPVTGGSALSFTSNCQLMGPMTQRLINSNCSGSTSSFNATTLDLKGDNTIPGMIVSHRMVNHPRMTSNFGNFNVAPNIQVKASTPNTIQYLPVRTQHNATNNIRVPPSLEFLHRYTNPQMLGAGVSGPTSGAMENLSIGNQMSSQNDMKFTNGGNNIGLNINQANFFSGCNTLNTMCITDQDEVQSVNGIVNGSIISDHDMQMSLQGNLLRGLRPMRQTCINKSGAAVVTAGSRIQNPILSGKKQPSVVPNAILPFVTNDFESMDIVDQTVPIFNNTINGSAGSMQVYQQKPVNKVVRDSGLLPSLNSANNNITASENGVLLNDPLSSQSSVMISRSGLNNSNVLSNSLSTNGSVMSTGYALGSPMNYKSFVGPNSNDIKYAQQFHSFQQQLYATSIRGQQPENVSNSMHNPNNGSSASFFVNK